MEGGPLEEAKSPHSSKSEKAFEGSAVAAAGGVAKSPNRSATAPPLVPLITGPDDDRLPEDTEGGMRGTALPPPGGGGRIPPILLLALGRPVMFAAPGLALAVLLGMLMRMVCPSLKARSKLGCGSVACLLKRSSFLSCLKWSWSVTFKSKESLLSVSRLCNSVVTSWRVFVLFTYR